MFELNISCSKDFDELHIVFSDGTAMVTTNHNNKEVRKDVPKQAEQKPKKPQKQEKKKINRKEEYFDFDDYLDDNISQEVVEKPQIDFGERPVKVDSGLQNLNI